MRCDQRGCPGDGPRHGLGTAGRGLALAGSLLALALLPLLDGTFSTWSVSHALLVALVLAAVWSYQPRLATAMEKA